eukprot:4977471-Amphidinium_carterae.1
MVSERDQLAIHIPVASTLAIIAIVEFTGMLYFIILSVRNLWKSYRATHHKNDEDAVTFRYVLLSRFIWDDLPHLQSFSAMKVLAIVHPALIIRMLNDVSKKNTNGRKLLVKLFNLDDEQASCVCDDELSEACGELIIAYHKHGAAKKRDSERTASHGDYSGLPTMEPARSLTSPPTPKNLHDLASSFAQQSLYGMVSPELTRGGRGNRGQNTTGARCLSGSLYRN